MYERDKNSASVIIWSLGRNAGEGGSLKACGDYLKQHDNRPVMYEGDNYDIAGVYSEQAARGYSKYQADAGNSVLIYT